MATVEEPKTCPIDVSARGMCRSFVAFHPMLAFQIIAISFASPIESVISPILIGELSESIAKGGVNATRYIALIAIVYVIVLAIYNIELVKCQEFSGAMAAHIQSRLMKHFFDTHEIGSATVTTDEIAINIRIYTESMGAFIENMRNIILPDVLSLLLQSFYIAIAIDMILGAMILVIFIATIYTIYTAMTTKASDSVDAYESETAVFNHVNDILDNFTTVIGEPDGVYSEMYELNLKGDALVRTRKNAAKASIKFAIWAYVAIIGAAIFYLYRYYKIFLEDMLINGGGVKNTDFQEPVTAIVILFSSLKIARSMIYHLFDITDSFTRMESAKELFESENAGGDPLHFGEGGVVGLNIAAIPFRVASSYPAIEFRDVSFSYKTRRVFEGIHFSVKQGSRANLKGPNGCGKTTIMKMLNRHAEPTKGEIRIFGKPIREISPTALRATIAYAEQSPKLFDRTILENICYRGPKTKGLKPELAIAGIERLGLTQFFKNSFPAGLMTRVGKGGKDVSGGQRQIIQLARIALKEEVKIVLLDEITSSVDFFHRKVITELVKKCFLDKTVILITHDENLTQVQTREIDVGAMSIALNKPILSSPPTTW
jgi:ABC-type multidrug transport system fused ATPase/permease subunit